MAVKTDATSASSAWVAGMGTAGPKYEAGVQAVKTAPGQLAAAAANLWATNVANSKSKFARNVGAVSLSSWQNAAVTKGSPRLASGAQAAEPKFAAFMGKFIPVLTNVVNGLGPRGTFEQNIARFTSYAQGLHAQKGNFN